MALNTFETEVSAAARHLGIYYRKLLVGTLGPDTRFTLRSPYDSFLVAQGRIFALELKMMKEHGSLPLANIQEHQIEGLQEVIRAGGEAWLLVNMRRRKEKSENRAWALDIRHWDALMARVAAEQRKSIPYRYFTEGVFFQELPRERMTNAAGETERIWNLNHLLYAWLDRSRLGEVELSDVEAAAQLHRQLPPDDLIELSPAGTQLVTELELENPWARALALEGVR